jgi:hypothetical protein
MCLGWRSIRRQCSIGHLLAQGNTREYCSRRGPRNPRCTSTRLRLRLWVQQGERSFGGDDEVWKAPGVEHEPPVCPRATLTNTRMAMAEITLIVGWGFLIACSSCPLPSTMGYDFESMCGARMVRQETIHRCTWLIFDGYGGQL